MRVAEKLFQVETTHATFAKICNALYTNRPFVYSRYGDGDFEVMCGRPDAQQSFSEALAVELEELFFHDVPNNLVGVCMHSQEPGMETGTLLAWDNPLYVDILNQYCATRVFENAIPLHYYCMFRPLEMRHFLHELAKVPNKVFVGNTSRELVEAVLGPVKHYVPVEYVDAYASIDQWWPEVDKLTQEPMTVISAAGLSTRAMHRRLLLKGYEGQALDFGSVIDFLTGFENRTWICRAGNAGRLKVVGNVTR